MLAMSKLPHFVRPTFAQALSAWKEILAHHGFSDNLLWIYDENLCFEPDPAGQDGLSLRYQLQFTPPPREAEQVAFDYFAACEARLVFYRAGSNRGKSVCLMLCDEYFEAKTDKDGFIKKDDWLMAFRPGTTSELEEITEESRWNGRVIRDRPLHDVDFSMTLRGIHELQAHGRVLTTYEKYALRFLGAWRRVKRESN